MIACDSRWVPGCDRLCLGLSIKLGDRRLVEMEMAKRDPVVIAGAGPVAMVLAVALYREGVPFIALETLHEPFMDQRAASHHPPTVEMLDRLGLAEHMLEEGLKSPIYRFHDRVNHDVVAQFDLGDLREELKFPFVLQYEQYKVRRSSGLWKFVRFLFAR